MTDRLPHEKGFHISWDQIHRDSRALAWRLDGKGPDDGAWKAVVAITRGGMAPAMIVARELDIRTVDTISVKSYHSSGGAADERRDAVLKYPDADMMGDGTGILIIDDLVDSGKTLEVVRALYPRRTAPPSMPNPWASRWCTPSSPASPKTHGSSSHGTWPCNTSSPIAARTKIRHLPSLNMPAGGTKSNMCRTAPLGINLP